MSITGISLGWKDRFSSPLFSARQQDYGKAFHLESVYTPQIVVNGEKEVLGSDSRAVQEAIGEAAKEASSPGGHCDDGRADGFLQRVEAAGRKP